MVETFSLITHNLFELFCGTNNNMNLKRVWEDHDSIPQAYHIHRVTPSSSSSSFPVSPSSGPGLLESGGVMGGGCP